MLANRIREGAMARHRFVAAMLALGLTGLAAAALLLSISPSAAQQSEDSPFVCTLSDEQTRKAIDAFARLMPVFHHDRCANCHNKIDPFEPRGHVDIREALQALRDRNLLDTVRHDTSVSLDVAHAAITRYLDGEPLTPAQRVEFMFSNACSVCHDPPPGRDSWRMPPPTDSFHDKAAEELCRHIHTNDLTKTPASFEKHMREDGFVGVAFAGTRGLNGVGIGVYEESTGAFYADKPILSPSHGAMVAIVREWLDAQRNEFSRNAACGCRPFRYALTYEAEMTTAMAARGGSVTGSARGRTKVPLSFADDGTFSGGGSMTLPSSTLMNMGPAGKCTMQSETLMAVRLRGHVTETGRMVVTGVNELAPTTIAVACQTERAPFSYGVPMGGQTVPVDFELDAQVGAQIRKEHGGSGVRLRTEIELIEDR
jgi:hypothetical protein